LFSRIFPRSFLILHRRFLLFLIFFSHKPLPNQTRREKQFDYLYSLVSFFGVLLAGFLIAAMAFILFFGGILTGKGIEYYGMLRE
jgi:hypothetical protein